MLILTAIWGLGCGVLFPAFILAAGSEIVHEAIASDPVIVVWLITAVVGYVISMPPLVPIRMNVCAPQRISSSTAIGNTFRLCTLRGDLCGR